MAALLPCVRGTFLRPKKWPMVSSRSINTDFSLFREGDRVFLCGQKHPHLTGPLAEGKEANLRNDVIAHSDIIGKRARDSVQTKKGIRCRLRHPTLEEFATLTPRLVTPVYPPDANLLVSLLDIHTPSPSQTGEVTKEPLEILEAGTGHGSLTLHLARAISGGNKLPQSIPRKSQRAFYPSISPGPKKERLDDQPEAQIEKEEREKREQEEWDEYRSQRQAIIHTVESHPQRSAHAEKVVRTFRRGIYAGSVDFYVSSVEDWIKAQNKRRLSSSSEGETPRPYLSHAILDMPSAEHRIPLITPVLKPDGLIAVFVPSITQIGECVKIIKDQNLPLVMESTVELGTGISSGRLWDVRMAVVRSSTKSVEEQPKENDEEAAEASAEENPTEDTGEKGEHAPPTQRDVMVCRPKVGARVVGGGFVGLWRRKRD